MGQPRDRRERTEIYRGRVISLWVETTTRADGASLRWEIVDHPGAVAILALDDRGQVLLVRQHRAPIDRELLELPAGTLKEGEAPQACAQRELAEETGHQAERWELLAECFSTPGFSNERVWIYLAQNLSETGAPAPEADEELEVLRVPRDEVLAMLDRGQIRDAKTMLGLLLLNRKGRS